MTLHVARPICRIWEYDGDQASIDELNALMAECGLSAQVAADGDSFRMTNSTERWPLETLEAQEPGTVVMVYVDPGGNLPVLTPFESLQAAQDRVDIEP